MRPSPRRLEILARRAAGSMRDSQSLLEQLLAFGGQQITVGRRASHAGHRRRRPAGAAGGASGRRAMRRRRWPISMRHLAEGVDVGQLLDQLLGYFRDVMVPPSAATADSVSVCDRRPSRREAQGRSRAAGVRDDPGHDADLDQTLARLRYSTHGRTLAELALVRICKLDDLDELPMLIAQVARRYGRHHDCAGGAARSGPLGGQLPPASAGFARDHD